MTPLVVGVGNAWRGDDGAGPAVVLALGLGDRVVQHEREPSALIGLWEHEDEVVLVDTVRSGARAGTVHRIDLHESSLPPELSRGSTHAFGLAETVELARALDRLPARLELYGIEGSAFEAGRGLQPEVARAVDRVVEELAERLGA